MTPSDIVGIFGLSVLLLAFIVGVVRDILARRKQATSNTDTSTWIGAGTIDGVETSIRVTVSGGLENHPEISGITWRRP